MVICCLLCLLLLFMLIGWLILLLFIISEKVLDLKKHETYYNWGVPQDHNEVPLMYSHLCDISTWRTPFSSSRLPKYNFKNKF